MQNKTITAIITASVLLIISSGCVSVKPAQEQVIDYLIADGYSEAQSKFNMATEYNSSFYPDNVPYSLEYKADAIKYGIPLDVFFVFYDFSTEMINKFTIVYFEDETGKRRCFQKENVHRDKGTDVLEFQTEIGDPKGIRVKNPLFYLWH